LEDACQRSIRYDLYGMSQEIMFYLLPGCHEYRIE
jgi:hypothetical protein